MALLRMKDIILYIWQLPQNLLGLVLIAWYNGRITDKVWYNDRRYYVVSYMAGGGVSLGNYVIMRNSPFGTDWTAWQHEYGHTRQSFYLGPLYLLVIGLPSVLWLLWHRAHRKRSYYWFYTERWADKLGGVTR